MALMGASGAGKTTLLDVLARCVSRLPVPISMHHSPPGHHSSHTGSVHVSYPLPLHCACVRSRKNTGVMTGTITLNGHPKDYRTFNRITAYVRVGGGGRRHCSL